MLLKLKILKDKRRWSIKNLLLSNKLSSIAANLFMENLGEISSSFGKITPHPNPMSWQFFVNYVSLIETNNITMVLCPKL